MNLFLCWGRGQGWGAVNDADCRGEETVFVQMDRSLLPETMSRKRGVGLDFDYMPQGHGGVYRS